MFVSVVPTNGNDRNSSTDLTVDSHENDAAVCFSYYNAIYFIQTI